MKRTQSEQATKGVKIMFGQCSRSSKQGSRSMDSCCGGCLTAFREGEGAGVGGADNGSVSERREGGPEKQLSDKTSVVSVSVTVKV